METGGYKNDNTTKYKMIDIISIIIGFIIGISLGFLGTLIVGFIYLEEILKWVFKEEQEKKNV